MAYSIPLSHDPPLFFVLPFSRLSSRNEQRVCQGPGAVAFTLFPKNVAIPTLGLYGDSLRHLGAARHSACAPAYVRSGARLQFVQGLFFFPFFLFVYPRYYRSMSKVVPFCWWSCFLARSASELAPSGIERMMEGGGETCRREAKIVAEISSLCRIEWSC